MARMDIETTVDDEYKKQKHNEKLRARYAERRQNHQCTKCGKTDERTLKGYSKCTECNDKLNNIARKYRRSDENRRHIRTLRNKRGYKRVLEGVCTICGKNPPKPNRLNCEECIFKAKVCRIKRKDKKICST